MAKKNDKRCRVMYYPNEDKYSLEVWCQDTQSWELDVSCKCQSSARNPDPEPAFIHYKILTSLCARIQMGYKLEDTL